MCPRVDVNPAATAEVGEQGAVNNAELKTELVPHLLLPLNLNRGRAYDQNASCAVTQDQLLRNKTCLDRLAQADVVGDEQIDPRHRQRAHDWIELVVVDVYAASERGLQRPIVGRRHGTPGDGIKERVEDAGRVVALQGGKLCPVQSRDPRFKLPDD